MHLYTKVWMSVLDPWWEIRKWVVENRVFSRVACWHLPASLPAGPVSRRPPEEWDVSFLHLIITNAVLYVVVKAEGAGDAAESDPVSPSKTRRRLPCCLLTRALLRYSTFVTKQKPNIVFFNQLILFIDAVKRMEKVLKYLFQSLKVFISFLSETLYFTSWQPRVRGPACCTFLQFGHLFKR